MKRQIIHALMGLLAIILVTTGYLWLSQTVGGVVEYLPFFIVALCIILPAPLFRFLGYGIGYIVRIFTHRHLHSTKYEHEDESSYDQGYQATTPSIELKHRLMVDFIDQSPSPHELPQAQYPQQQPPI